MFSIITRVADDGETTRSATSTPTHLLAGHSPDTSVPDIGVGRCRVMLACVLCASGVLREIRSGQSFQSKLAAAIRTPVWISGFRRDGQNIDDTRARGIRGAKC